MMLTQVPRLKAVTRQEKSSDSKSSSLASLYDWLSDAADQTLTTVFDSVNDLGKMHPTRCAKR